MTQNNAAEMQFLATVTVDGFGNVGVFDKFSGGDSDAQPAKHRPGGMGPQVSYLALPTFSDCVVSRVYDEQRDHVLIGTLRPLVGRHYCNFSVQPLDADGNPWGNPRTYRGRMSKINDGNADSNSNAPRMWEITMATEDVNN